MKKFLKITGITALILALLSGILWGILRKQNPRDTVTSYTGAKVEIEKMAFYLKGDKISGRIYRPVQDSLDKMPAVIYCHSLGKGMEDGDSFCRGAAGKGYVGFSFDFRGGSRTSSSTGLMPSEMTLSTEIQDLKAPVTATESKDGTTGALPKIRELCEQLNAVTAAKDARTCIVSPANDPVYLNTTGSHGMATAGSGDVLAGMTAAFLAMPWDSSGEHSAAYTAACAAVCLHGAAGDLAADRIGPRSLMAGDIADALPELFS